MVFIDDIIEGVVKFVLHLIFDVIFFYTGECVLYILTFGKKKPRWDFYEDEAPIRWAIFTEINWWIGFLFWVFIIGWIASKLLA